MQVVHGRARERVRDVGGRDDGEQQRRAPARRAGHERHPREQHQRAQHHGCVLDPAQPRVDVAELHVERVRQRVPVEGPAPPEVAEAHGRGQAGPEPRDAVTTLLPQPQRQRNRGHEHALRPQHPGDHHEQRRLPHPHVPLLHRVEADHARPQHHGRERHGLQPGGHVEVRRQEHHERRGRDHRGGPGAEPVPVAHQHARRHHTDHSRHHLRHGVEVPVERGEQREQQHPAEVREPLHRIGTDVPHGPVPVGEVLAVPEGDVGVVHGELDRRPRAHAEHHDEPEEEGGLPDYGPKARAWRLGHGHVVTLTAASSTRAAPRPSTAAAASDAIRLRPSGSPSRPASAAGAPSSAESPRARPRPTASRF